MKKNKAKYLLLLLIVFSCVNTKSLNNEKSLQRPILGNGTVLTSYGTMLRGVRWSLDRSGELPDREAVREIRDFGMNSLHVYVERHDSGVPAGSYVEQMDTLAKWCGEDGLYCVITIGGGGNDGHFDLDFARKFWNTYAPRYADMPWVIYEIHNEPDKKWRSPYEPETMAMEQEMYDLIRTYAPDTMILLFTLGTQSKAEDVISDVNALDVDWSNAAVAIHGFGGTGSAMLQPVKDAGINMICTELGVTTPFSNDQVDAEAIDLCERHELAWLSFIEIHKGYLNSWRFKEEIDKRNVGWTPDSGNWPKGPSKFIPPNDLARGKKTFVSSEENFMGTGEILKGEYATDGLDYTRWGSGFADNQYIMIDFGKPEKFDLIVINWEGQWGVDWDILVSDDMKNWKIIYSVTDYKGPGHPVYFRQRIKVDAEGRYMKLDLKMRHMQWGFSMYDLEVYNTADN